jgi:hypothetical protein
MFLYVTFAVNLWHRRMPLTKGRKLNPESITSVVEEMPLSKLRKLCQYIISITSGAQEVPLPNSRRIYHDSITITSVMSKKYLHILLEIWILVVSS